MIDSDGPLLYENPWIFENKPFLEIPEKVICFVYMITNLIDGRKYIGKKRLYFSKTKQIKGKKKKYKALSDWHSYYGSNDALNEDVKILGPKNFKREILKLCTMQAESSYYEAKYQMEYDVLLNPKDFYNSWLSLKVTSKHLVRFHVNK